MRKILAGVVLGLCVGTAQASDRIDLSGTYEGTYACDGTFAGFPIGETFTFEAHVVQDGNRIRLSYLDEGDVLSVYEGLVDEVAPGGNFLTGILQACGGDFDFEEVLRIQNGYAFEEEDGFTASFDGTSIFVTNGFPGSEGELDIETCTYVFNRTATEPGRVARCDFRSRILKILESED